MVVEKPRPTKENGAVGEGYGAFGCLSPEGPRTLTNATNPRSRQVQAFLKEHSCRPACPQRAGEADTYSAFHTLNSRGWSQLVRVLHQTTFHKAVILVVFELSQKISA